MKKAMNVFDWVSGLPRWTDSNEMDVVAANGQQFILVASCELDGTKLIAIKKNGRRGKWMRFVDFAQTPFTANFLDSLTEFRAWEAA